MTLIFHIPPVLRGFAAGQSSVTIEGAPRSAGEALALLFAVHPGLRDRVTNERGALRPHVNVFLGDEAVRFLGGLAAPLPVAATVEISIVPAVSGGSGSGAWA